MSIRVRFACGHGVEVETGTETPVCATCGERRIARTTAPAPRFRGIAVGPCAEYVELPAARVALTTKEQ